MIFCLEIFFFCLVCPELPQWSGEQRTRQVREARTQTVLVVPASGSGWYSGNLGNCSLFHSWIVGGPEAKRVKSKQ